MKRQAKVIHATCGTQIGWWLSDYPMSECDLFLSSTFERMDGTHPREGSTVAEYCPKCDKHNIVLTRVLLKQ